MRVYKDDVLCLLSAIRVLEEERYNDTFLNPKKRLLVRMAVELNNDEFDSIRTPKWLKKARQRID